MTKFAEVIAWIMLVTSVVGGVVFGVTVATDSRAMLGIFVLCVASIVIMVGGFPTYIGLFAWLFRVDEDDIEYFHDMMEVSLPAKIILFVLGFPTIVFSFILALGFKIINMFS